MRHTFVNTRLIPRNSGDVPQESGIIRRQLPFRGRVKPQTRGFGVSARASMAQSGLNDVRYGDMYRSIRYVSPSPECLVPRSQTVVIANLDVALDFVLNVPEMP